MTDDMREAVLFSLSNNLPFPPWLDRLMLSGEYPELYTLYLQSEYWTSRRDKYKKTKYWAAGCAVCQGTPEAVHHRDYGSIGKEGDKDLLPLCRDHHTQMHGRDVGKKFTQRDDLLAQEKRLLSPEWLEIVDFKLAI